MKVLSVVVSIALFAFIVGQHRASGLITAPTIERLMRLPAHVREQRLAAMVASFEDTVMREARSRMHEHGSRTDDSDHDEWEHCVLPPQPVGTPLPLERTPLFASGVANYILADPSWNASQILPATGSFLLVDPANQRWLANDTFAGALTNASGSWIWELNPEGTGYVCYTQPDATYASQLSVSKTSVQVGINGMRIDVAKLNRWTNRYENVSVPTYLYDGQTKYFGGTGSPMDFGLVTDLCNRAYHFLWGSMNISPRNLNACPQCTPQAGTTNLHCNFAGPGAVRLPISAARENDWVVDESCLHPLGVFGDMFCHA